MKLLFDIIGAVILITVLLTMVMQLNNINIKNNILKFIICTIILSIYMYFSYLLTMIFARYALFLLIGSIVISRFYNVKISKIFCTLFFSWVIFLFSECIFTLIIGIFFKNIEIFYGSLLSNIIISFLSYCILQIKFIKEKIIFVINKIINSEISLIYFSIFILSLSFSIIIYINYYNKNVTVNFILSLFVMIVQATITVMLFLEKNASQNTRYEYNALLNNLNEYEKMLDYQKVMNHENKNELLVIKGMINKNQNNVTDYIDSIIKEQHADNEELLYKTNKIPEGGLRGLVYYKLLTMKDKKINISLDIDNKVRKINFSDIDVNRDLCKILGVFLDNSMQALDSLEEKNINIVMYVKEHNLIIKISNNFQDYLNIEKMDELGYTTKGTGHGYGLTLVKELLTKHTNIVNRRLISGNVFTQELIIEI